MIRLSTKDDIPGLMDLAEATGLFPVEHLEVLREMLAGHFESEDGSDRFWLTEEDAGVVGMAYCEAELMTHGTWNLRLIAVAPSLQGQGRGRRLLEHVEQHLRKEGARLLLVDTSGTEAFTAVRAFYAGCGYQQESRIQNFFAAGDDKVTFTKPLQDG